MSYKHGPEDCESSGPKYNNTGILEPSQEGLFPSWLTALDRISGGRVSETIYRIGVLLHGERGRKRFSPGLATLSAVGGGLYLAAVPAIVRAQEVETPEVQLFAGGDAIDVTNVVPEEIIAAVPIDEASTIEAAPIDPTIQPEFPKTPAQLFEERLQKERERGYTQFLTTTPETGGILIKAPASVDPKALERARLVIQKMMPKDPEIVTQLASKNISALIIPKDKKFTELPQFLGYAGHYTRTGKLYDEVRVLSGFGTSIVGEEFFIRDANARTALLIHEHGHTIMDYSFSESQLKRWEEIFKRVDKSKKCEGMYTCFDEREFWAEMTAIWFFEGTTLQYGFNNGLVIRRPEDIKLLDPEAYKFLIKVYGYPNW